MASDATFIWNGGTGAASNPSNWSPVAGSVPNSPNTPESDDDVIISGGDAQFTDTPLPGLPDNGGARGTILMQGGEIDMINSGSAGASAGLLGDAGAGATVLTVANTVAAVATLTSTGSITNNGTIDSDANGNLTFSVLAGDAANPGLIEATSGGSLVIQSAGSGTFSNFGAQIYGSPNVSGVLANGGSILVTASIGTNGGYWGLFGGGTIEVNTPMPTSGTFDFSDGANDLMKLDQPATFQGSIIDMGPGDVIDFGSLNVGTIAYDGTNLTLEASGGSVLATVSVPGIFSAATNAPIQSGTFAVTDDGQTSVDGLFFMTGTNGDQLVGANSFSSGVGGVSCFAAGTRIGTENGSVAVESLKVGDQVCTIIGGKPQSIVWIGHRQVDCSRHPQPRKVWPIRISAGAFGRLQPSRDLWLSPDHAVYADGVLIPAKYLVNGETVVQVPCDSVTYYHIETQRHEVVLAEGLATETYLAGADRTMFANHAGPVAMHPDFSTRVWEAAGCAELIVTGPVLDAVRARLDEIAQRKPTARKRAA